MRDRRRSGLGAWALALLLTLPLAVLPVRAVADVWRAPAVVPQEIGLRGLEVVLAPGSGVPGAVTTSLLVAALATGLALVVGWPAARWLAGATTRVRTVALVGVALPVLVPEFAVGTGLATWFLRLGLADRLAGLTLAHLVYVLPYVVLVLTPGFSGEVRDLEEMAATQGATGLQRLGLVTVPAVAPTLAAATLLGLVVSWSQYGTSLAVGGGRLTLPVVLLPFVRSDPQVAALLGVVFLLPPVAALVAVRSLARAGTAGWRPREW